MNLRTWLPLLAPLLAAMTPPAAAQEAAGARWQGPYLGVQVGVLSSEGVARLDGAEGFIIPFDVENGIFPRRRTAFELSASGGVLAGYNWQRGRTVLGVEADISLADASTEARFVRTDTNATGPDGQPWPFEGTTTATRYLTEIDALATLRLRAGLAAGRTLFYATGGLAAGATTNRFSLAFDLPPYANAWREREVRLGYVAGLGIERAYSQAVSLKAELLHYDLRDAVVRASDPAAFPGEGIDYRFRNRGQILRVGLNFRF